MSTSAHPGLNGAIPLEHRVDTLEGRVTGVEADVGKNGRLDHRFDILEEHLRQNGNKADSAIDDVRGMRREMRRVEADVLSSKLMNAATARAAGVPEDVVARYEGDPEDTSVKRIAKMHLQAVADKKVRENEKKLVIARNKAQIARNSPYRWHKIALAGIAAVAALTGVIAQLVAEIAKHWH